MIIIHRPLCNKVKGHISDSVCLSVCLLVIASVCSAGCAEFWMDTFHIWHKWSLAYEGMSLVMTLSLCLYLQGHYVMTANKIWHISSCVCSTAPSAGNILFPHIAQMITILWLLTLTDASNVIRQWFCNKYCHNITHRVRFITSADLDVFNSYMAQLMRSIRGCIRVCIYVWSCWVIYSEIMHSKLI